MIAEYLLFFLLFGCSESWGQGKRLLSLSIYFVLFYEAVNEKTRYPALKFGGRIVYSRTATEVEKAAEELLKNLEAEKRESGQVVLGFDIEWRPSFRRGQLISSFPWVLFRFFFFWIGSSRCKLGHILVD